MNAYGRWLPHQDALEGWLDRLSKDVRPKAGRAGLHPAVEEFRELIHGDPIIRLLIAQMIEQLPTTRNYAKRHLKGADHLLLLIDDVIRRAPEYDESGF